MVSTSIRLGHAASATWSSASGEGRSERTSDLLFRFYRWLRFRGLGDEAIASSLKQSIEHEALVSALAAGDGTAPPGCSASPRSTPTGWPWRSSVSRGARCRHRRGLRRPPRRAGSAPSRPP